MSQAKRSSKKLALSERIKRVAEKAKLDAQMARQNRVPANVKCDCGHSQKDHYQGAGWCHHSKHPRAGQCGCTWFHPNVRYIRRMQALKAKQAKESNPNTMETVEQEVGHHNVAVGATTQGSETIARNLSYQAAIELAESRMNLMGGHWKTLYEVSNGKHLFRMDEHETLLADNTPYIFIGGMPFFGQEGTH